MGTLDVLTQCPVTDVAQEVQSFRKCKTFEENVRLSSYLVYS